MELNPDQGAVEGLIREFLSAQGLDFVELTFRREGRNLIVRLLADRPEGGITMGECTEINRRLAYALEEKNLIPGSYILEVNSPGLDRPLKTKQDFTRCLNRQAKFFLAEPINGRIEMDGLIQEVFEDSVDVLSPAGITRIPYAAIHKAQQLF
jgi:ribosome maturation factor RimP